MMPSESRTGPAHSPSPVAAASCVASDVRLPEAGCRPPALELRPSRRAFTLVELTIVVLLIGIFAALAVPKFVGSLCFHRLRAAARRIEADLQLAQHQARMTGSSQTVVFNVAGSSYTIPDLPPLEPGGTDYTVQLRDSLYGVTIVSADFGGQTLVEYDGFGMPVSGGSVVLQCGPYQRSVLVDGQTGQTVVTETYDRGC